MKESILSDIKPHTTPPKTPWTSFFNYAALDNDCVRLPSKKAVDIAGLMVCLGNKTLSSPLTVENFNQILPTSGKRNDFRPKN